MSRRLAGGLLAGVLSAVAGCEGPPKPVFPGVDPALVWPRPPDPPRIRYIGQLRGEADLGVRTRGLAAIGELFTGPRQKTGFSTPMAVAVRGETVCVADGQAQAVYVMDLSARTFAALRQAGGRSLEWPIDVAFVGDRLAVADSRRGAVFLFGSSGAYEESLGEGLLQRPTSVAVDRRQGDLWVADAAAHDCKVFGADGVLRARVGERGASAGQFNFPIGVAFDPGRGMLVADSMNFRVQALGPPASMFGKKGDAAGDFALPRDVAVDSEGHAYVLDSQFENVQIFDREGRLLMAWGQEGRGPGEFYLPSGITIDEQDRVWIADTYNRRVQVFQFLREAQE
jgi:DNA-binding beta-propeller fold protein YncE